MMRVPFHSVLNLAVFDHTPLAAEQAHHLIQRMHADPEFNATWSTFWDVLPGPDSVLTPEVFTDHLLGMLQAPVLENLIRYHRTAFEQVYFGTYPHYPHAPLNETVPESVASLDTFKWVAALLTSRTWTGDALPTHMTPLLDFVNHDTEGNNALREEEDGAVVLRATHPIKSGEAITTDYQGDVIHRPDMSLFVYGFVVMSDTPPLCSFDLPTFKGNASWFQQTPADDSFYDELESGHVTWQEHRRLGARLLEGSTTLAEDEELLANLGPATDWREQMVLQFRVLRKRALVGARQRIEAALSAPHAEL